jgi:predicted secreted protein
VRGDPRTADYTVRFIVQVSAPAALNDNLQPVPARQPTPPRVTYRPRLHRLAQPLGAATMVLAAVAISGGVWLAVTFGSMIADVF